MRKRRPRKTAPSDRPEPQSSGFDALELSPDLLAALNEAAYEQPTPVQAGVIPVAKTGRDVLAQARTGTGKTAAFSIPILERLQPRREVKAPQVLILVPTRELAVQVDGEVKKLGKYTTAKCVAVYGGQPIRRQIEKLAHGCQIVVGTPGRVIDHIRRGTLDVKHLTCVVLDEADRMLDIGFRPAIEKILRACPTDRQTMLLSATLAPEVERLSRRYMQDPVHINCSSTQISVATIEQRYFTVRQEEKQSTLIRLLQREQPQQAIIFCRTKRGTDRLHRALQNELSRIDSLKSAKLACIHDDMNQRDRDRVFGDLRNGQVGILVATDVVGRGIDVSTVSHIINYDMPLDCDDYVHRVGRTGRMGREGIAFTFVTADEGPQLTAIELNINRLLERDSLDPTAKPKAREVVAEPVAEEPAAPRKKRLFPMKRKAGRLARAGGKAR
ncbi:MAG: DEAD/DEAH box helicase [Planctomycetales bacterium]|nr:DEAD/DEAH box helicase [Planctomycetales bacterium]